MRLGALTVLILLAVGAGAALADKYDPNEKPWRYDPMPSRADYQEQEPNNTCPGLQQLQCLDRIVCASYDPATDDDFFQVFIPAGTLVSVSTESCNGSEVDTYLELYDPSCGSRLAYDDDGGPGMFSLISNYPITSDGWYNIKTYTYNHSYTGSYTLFINCSGIHPQGDPNDTCNPDYFIERCTQGVLDGDMTLDYNDYDPGSGGCASGYPEAGVDLAYRLDLQADDIVDLTYYTPSFDAAFYIVTDCANVSETCVIGADSGYDTESIHYEVPTSGTYWLILDHYGTNTGRGPWTLNYNLQCPVTPVGACCIGEDCVVLTEDDCVEQGGLYIGDNVACDENTCVPVPVEEARWGRIKASYR